MMMSTRSQVQIVQEGMGHESKRTLYHHCDGYPTGILPLLNKAHKDNPGWESSRAGKAASFLCAVDPGGFEPEEGHDLHGDIEYYYQLFVTNHNGGTGWEVVVYSATLNHNSPVSHDKVDLTAISERMTVRKAAQMAEQIERNG